MSNKVEFKKACNAAGKFNDYFKSQQCSDPMSVLQLMGEWYKKRLSPSIISQRPVLTTIAKEAQKIYPKYYEHTMQLSGPPSNIGPGFFDVATVKARHELKSILHRMLAIADETINALFQWILAMNKSDLQKTVNIWNELCLRF